MKCNCPLLTLHITGFLHALFTCSYEYDDPRIQQQIDDFKKQYEIVGNGLLADYIPVVRHLPLPQAARFKEFLNTYFARIQEELDGHRKSFDPGMLSLLQSSTRKSKKAIIFLKTILYQEKSP